MLLIIGPDPFISQSSPDHSPQPRINFSYYKYVPRHICFLICDMLPTVAHYTRLHLDNGDTPIDLHLTIEIMKISNSNQVNFIILCSFFLSIISKCGFNYSMQWFLSLPLGVKEGPVKCVKVCNQSWVILVDISEMKRCLFLEDHLEN